VEQIKSCIQLLITVLGNKSQEVFSVGNVKVRVVIHIRIPLIMPNWENLTPSIMLNWGITIPA